MMQQDLPKEQESFEQDAFFNERMIPLGVTEENNTIELFNPEAEPPMSKVATQRIFWYDQKGNITITYYTIEGHVIIYYREELKNPKPERYMTKRLREPKGDMKYQMPAKQKPYPWFHPITVKAFKNKEKIETLYLTEGVFKSFAAGEEGLHVIGLSSITHYRGADRQIHRDIRRLIQVCQVERVCILWDGDCLNISKKDIQRREEATRRPQGFFRSAKEIRRLLIAIEDQTEIKPIRVYFAYIKSDIFEESPKGLDDLIMVARQHKRIDQVVDDLTRLEDRNGPFFYRTEITETTNLLLQHFALDDVKKFYGRHAQEIGDKEFFFKRNMYIYIDRDDEVKMLQPYWAKSLYWIGDEFFEEVLMPSANPNIKQRELVHRKMGTLTQRFGKGFVKYLEYYYGFVNVPNHFQYERIIEMDEKRFFNKYFPFPHVPKEGKWNNIEMFLKHIFGEQPITHPKTGEEIPNWYLGLDYLQLLLCNPTQALPIVVLYSRENQTGKSTFGELCYRMLGDNVIFIGNSDLQSDFNEIYAGRLLAICEETLLERRRDADRIKNMSTATRMTINPKGQKQYTIDFFCKFQFYSNNPRMVYVTRHDDRYWILKVKAIPKDKLDPELKDRMWAELPAFVHYLKHRQMVTKRESRMHFNPDLLRTEVFMDTVQLNEPTAASDLREAIRDMFYDLGAQVKVIEMPLKNILEEFFKSKANRKWVQEILKDYLNVELLRDKNGKQIQKRGEYSKLVFNEYGDDGNGTLDIKTVKWKGRPYVFNREEFIEEEVVEELATSDAFNDTEEPF